MQATHTRPCQGINISFVKTRKCLDGAATTLINLSIGLQEVGGGDEGDTDWECRHTGCDDISMVSRWCPAVDISDSEGFFFFFFLPLVGA